MSNRPTKKEYATFYKGYIDSVPEGTLMDLLESVHAETQAFFQKVGEINGNFRYRPEKWTLKEVLMHMIDTEKIMAYRALRVARNDETALPGFDENEYAKHVDVTHRTIKDLLEEYQLTRKLTIQTFKHFGKDKLANIGTASGNPISVRALGYIIIGHELHHKTVILERYLGSDSKLQQME